MNKRKQEELRELLARLKEERTAIKSAAEAGDSYDDSHLKEWKEAFVKWEAEEEKAYEALSEKEQCSAKGEVFEDELSVMEEALDILGEALEISGGNPGREQLREMSLILTDVIEELWDIL